MARKQFELKAFCYDKKGKLLSVGTNSYTKTHPLMYEFGKKVNNEHAIFIHAELHAVLQALKRGVPKSIHIERYDVNGNPRLAKPCEICQLMLTSVGIENITYTNNIG